ncbi:endonuclease domain-containing protein [Salegentibacter chungangensis]|uniref:Endonuclease domain-containing protein n=1 Tax=Salegentibacter chungangensis TaxID=1335724 RepID=A0ABW3NPZ9_9FLAO
MPNRKFEGRKFRRQHSIKNYIVDFYCPEEKDSKRDLELQQLGFTVLRFENKMVFDFLHRF